MSFRRRPLRPQSDAGFSILESVVALVIVFGVLLVLLRSLDSGVRIVSESRRQGAAAAFASELLERSRSLEWENIGLTDDSNDADCPAAASVDGVACSEWAGEFGVSVDGDGDYTFEGQKIIFVNPTATFDPFLSFHDRVTRDGTQFDRFLFVTQSVDGGGDPTFRKVTAIVQWTPPSGFRREVRQVSYVSEFEAPAQPVMTADVIYRGGSFELSGLVPGTASWLNPLITRPPLDAGTHVVLPGAQLSAWSDYVSGSSASVQGIEADFVWVDGYSQALPEETYAKRADDDFSSTIPLNDPFVPNVPLASWFLFDGFASNPLHDLIGQETADAVTPDHVEFSGEALSQEATDVLPYAELNVQSSGVVLVGFLEYRDDGPRNLQVQYRKAAQDLGLTADLTLESYGFALVNYGPEDGAALSYVGTVDRYETNPATRRIDTTLRWRSQSLYLFADDVYLAESGAAGYQGWIQINTPALDADLHAGAVASPSNLSAGNLSINEWDPVALSYQTVAVVNLDTITTPVPVSFVITYSIPGTSLHPQLDYTITADLEVNPMVGPNVTTDGSATVEVTMQVPAMVSGSIRYQVYDRIWQADLYDLAFSFETGGFDASSSYVIPGP